MLLRICILLGTIGCMFYFLGVIPGILGLAIGIYRIANEFGVFKTAKIFKGCFTSGHAYVKEFTGSYKSNGKMFEEANQIIQKFKKEKEYNVISIYYDNPDKTPEGKQKGVVGIYKKKLTSEFQIDKEIESYALENGYKKAEFPMSTSLYCSWDFTNPICMIFGIKKFYSELNKNYQNTQFRKQYKIVKDTYDCCIEIFETKTKMVFYVPTVNEKAFMIHSALPKTEETKDAEKPKEAEKAGGSEADKVIQ